MAVIQFGMAPLQEGRCTRAHPLTIALSCLMQEEFAGVNHERLIVAGLDAGQRLLSFITSRGFDLGVDGALITARKAMASERVRCLVMAHNHPCGTAAPSQADIAVTRRIAALARLGDVELVDHLIIAGDQVVSFRALGLL